MQEVVQGELDGAGVCPLAAEEGPQLAVHVGGVPRAVRLQQDVVIQVVEGAVGFVAAGEGAPVVAVDLVALAPQPLLANSDGPARPVDEGVVFLRGGARSTVHAGVDPAQRIYSGHSPRHLPITASLFHACT